MCVTTGENTYYVTLNFKSRIQKLHIDYKYKYSFVKTGEGNSNPLQYSCLENPMDGGTW